MLIVTSAYLPFLRSDTVGLLLLRMSDVHFEDLVISQQTFVSVLPTTVCEKLTD